MNKNNMDCDEFKNLGNIDDDNTLASCFFSLPPKQFALLSSLIGVVLIDNLTADQLNSLGNFMINIGQTILTAAAQEQLIEGMRQNRESRII